MGTKTVRRELQDAIQAGNFERAFILIPEFRGELSRELASAISNDDRRQKLRRATEFMEESLHLSRVIRAHLAARLRATESMARYQAPPDVGSRWSISG